MTNIQNCTEAAMPSPLVASKATGIIISLELRLKRQDSIIALGILESIRTKMPALEMIPEIKQMIQDNKPVMLQILGESLLNRIKFFPNV